MSSAPSSTQAWEARLGPPPGTSPAPTAQILMQMTHRKTIVAKIANLCQCLDRNTPTPHTSASQARPLQHSVTPLLHHPSIQRRLDGVEQRFFAERLPQEIHRTSGDGLRPLVIVCASRDKNDTNTSVGARQISLQFQAAQSQQPMIED